MFTLTRQIENGPCQCFCLAEDEKETEAISNGSRLIELDTTREFLFDEENKQWIPQDLTKYLASIELSGIETEQYEGLVLDGTVVVTAKYTDGTEAIVTNDAEISIPEILKAGENAVTAEYVEDGVVRRAVEIVTATEKALESIEVTTDPNKTEYAAGETFDPEGAAVTATFNNGQTEDVTESVEWTPAEELTADDVSAVASYTFRELTKQDTVSITVTNPEEEGA